MTVLNQVRRLIERLSPDPICDECISERLGGLVPQDASHEARELAGTGGFERQKDACAICRGVKLVTRHQPKRGG